jgi:HNH endonuclease
MTQARATEPTQAELQDLFRYEGGKLFWVKRPLHTKIDINKEAGTPHPKGYRGIKIAGRIYRTHRLIYIHHHGNIEHGLSISHKNHDRRDNNIMNLHAVTLQTAVHLEANHTAKGYSFNKATNKWQAQIKVNSKVIYLGRFVSEKEARLAHIVAVEKYHKLPETNHHHKDSYAYRDLLQSMSL